MSYLPIVLICVLLLLLLMIVIALIFSQKFRQDIIGAPGKANVMGILTVEGVVIVILCALFIGGIMFMVNEFRQHMFPKIANSIAIKDLPDDIQKRTPEDTIKEIDFVIEQANNPPDEVIKGRLLTLSSDSPLSKEIHRMRKEKKGPWFQTTKTLKVGIPITFDQPRVGYAYVCAGSEYSDKKIRLSSGLNTDYGERIDLHTKSGGIDVIECGMEEKKVPDFLLNCYDAEKIFSNLYIKCSPEGDARYTEVYFEKLKELKENKFYLPTYVIVKDF